MEELLTCFYIGLEVITRSILNNWIAITALIISIWSFKYSRDLNKRQIAKLETERLDKLKAAITIYKDDSNPRSKKLKIKNRGYTTAKNLKMELVDRDQERYIPDIKYKFPTNLEPDEEISITYSSEVGLLSRFKVMICWDDEFKKGNIHERDIN